MWGKHKHKLNINVMVLLYESLIIILYTLQRRYVMHVSDPYEHTV